MAPARASSSRWTYSSRLVSPLIRFVSLALRPCCSTSWAERAYPNLIYFNEVDKGGHFAAWEQPQLFTEELRAAFRSLR
jgi:pimeloyl-ACP methyl ester carboxylesterase